MSLSLAQLDEIIEGVRALTKSTDVLLLDGLEKTKTVVHKGEVDLVTEFDGRVEEMLIEGLGRLCPDFSFLAEESGGTPPGDSDTVWIIDPLDGTTNFAHGHPMFGTSIGLEHRGQLVAGVISVPALGRTYHARRGGGAFCGETSIRVSGTAKLDVALVATGYPYDRRAVDDDNTREHKAFMKSSQGVRRCGAAAVDMAFVAAGICDGFWEPRLHPWDLAAGVVLLEEAGGVSTDYSGGPVDIRSGWIVASNGIIHDSMLSVITRTRNELNRS